MNDFQHKFLLVCCILIQVVTTTAQAWEEINPGAGGQVQDIVPDPTNKDRVFLVSDMEGLYESFDNGLSWTPFGELTHNRAYAVTIDPSNGNNIYVGTLYGLEVSNDGGGSFQLIETTRGISIDAIAVKPDDSQIIIAGVGFRDDITESNFANTFGLGANGPAAIYRSEDAGTSWTYITLGGGSGLRNVYTVQFDPSNPNIVYAATAQGVYKSTNAGLDWTQMSTPSNDSYGVAVSPNGQTLYGVFGRDLYTTSATNISWQLKMNGLANQQYSYPEVDPRSTGSTHKVILAVLGDRDGLFEGTFDSNNGTYSWSNVFSGLTGYDYGWDQAAPNPRVAHYTPASAGWDPAIWSTSNQTIFRGEPTNSGYMWQNRYSIPNYNFTVEGRPTYATRGTASTYTFDIAVRGNYVIQSQADNGWMESWDGGTSWSNMQMRVAGNISDSKSADIGVLTDGTPIVIATGTQLCYGGVCFGTNSRLWLKKLNTSSPSDSWLAVAGSDRFQQGFGDGNHYNDVVVSPVKRERAFVSVNEDGVYLIDNLANAYNNGVSALQKIGLNGTRVWDMDAHPTNEDIVFCAVQDDGLYRGTKSGNNWNFVRLQSGSGADQDVETWVYQGNVMVAYAAEVNGETVYWLSSDGGDNFTTVFTPAAALAINTPDWYASISSEFHFSSKGGLEGSENTLFAVYYDHRMQKAYGIYKGTINASGGVDWVDFTDGIHFGGSTNMRLVPDGDGQTLYMSTAGGGAVRRDAGITVVMSEMIPADPTSLITTPASSSQINLNWNDGSNDETGFRIERKLIGGTFSEIATVGANVTTYMDTGLSASTTYVYRVRAYNGAGNSAFTNESSATTLVGNNPTDPCDHPNFITNSELNNLSDWQTYVNTGAGASANFASVDANLSGSQALHVSISNGGPGDSDIQFYTNVPLVAGKTYEVLYMARATGNRPMRVQLLKEGVFTNYGQHTVNLTTAVQEYSFEVTMAVSDNNVRLDFFTGANDNDVFIDRVIVREKCSTIVLPVELIAFAAEAVNDQTHLNWQTASEQNNARFEVEHSTDGVTFRKVGEVVGAGTTSQSRSYEFTHVGPVLGYNYYRLKQIDVDGTFTYSTVEMVNFSELPSASANARIRVYPNPVTDVISITVTGLPQETIAFSIYDMLGHVVMEQRQARPEVPIEIDLRQIASGIYLLRVHGLAGLVKIIKR